MEEDIISQLPEELIHRILSFLLTKEAIQTSVLSKRWRNVWLSVPEIDFSQVTIRTQDEASRFVEFVYSALLSRHSTTTVDTFHFDVYYPNEDIALPLSHFHKWVKFAVDRNVQNLGLCMDSDSIIPKLPNAVFCCKTLVALYLVSFVIGHNSSSTCWLLPSLKYLNLRSIRFATDYDFLVLLAACPNLEKLVATGIEWSNSDEKPCDKLKGLSLTKINGASVDSTFFYFPLTSIQHVQTLIMSIAKVNFTKHVIPTFDNLTYLKINSLNYRWRFLVEVLKHCPKLEELIVNEAGGHGATSETWSKKDDKERPWIDPEVVPECLSSHLKSCKLYRFLGLEGELRLACYILNNARVLEKMMIWNVGHTEVERLIFSWPKASAKCQVILKHRTD